MNKVELLKSIGKWILVLVMPIFILISIARILISPAYLQIEYRMPGFPEDHYGMPQEARLEFAPVAVKYVGNKEDIDYLANLEFESGSKLYNERELSHMVDVKDLVQVGKKVWVGLAAFIVMTWILAWKIKLLEWFKQSISFSGLITSSFLILISLLGIMNFDALFTSFHRIFFEDGTWLFYYTDTLIRLFPIRFWQDVVIAELVLSLATGLGLYFGFRKRALLDE